MILRILVAWFIILPFHSGVLEAQDVTQHNSKYRDDILHIDPGDRIPGRHYDKIKVLVFQRERASVSPDGQIRIEGRVNDADLRRVSRLANLEELTINGAEVTEAGLRELRKLDRLRALYFDEMQDADRKLEVIATFPSLEKLSIARSDATNAAAESLSKMKRLSYLDLEGTQIGNGFFQEHSLPQTITHLSLNETSVDSSIIKVLPRGLTHLLMIDTRIHPVGIKEIVELKHLKVLKFHSTFFDQGDIQRWKEALPNAEVNGRAWTRF